MTDHHDGSKCSRWLESESLGNMTVGRRAGAVTEIVSQFPSLSQGAADSEDRGFENSQLNKTYHLILPKQFHQSGTKPNIQT